MTENLIGICVFCKQKLAAIPMASHVISCMRRLAEDSPGFLLYVECSHQPRFWMLTEARLDGTLEHLDALFRATWNQCGGHTTSFAIDGDNFGSSRNCSPLDARLEEILVPGNTFEYELDFGRSPGLAIKVFARINCKSSKGPIRLLAQSDKTENVCQEY